MEVTVVVLAVLAAGFALLAAHQHRQLVDLEARVRLPDANAPASTGDEHDAIVIVIRNHHEVAAARTWLAAGLSALSPGLVRSLVHRETVRELRARLEAEGIDADVRVRRVLPGAPHDPAG